MPNYTRSVLGHVNAILNRMIREGTIASFRTYHNDSASGAIGLHLRVLANFSVDP